MSNSATVLDFIDEPRSACRVSVPGSMACLAAVALMSRLASSADSREATIQPTTQRL